MVLSISKQSNQINHLVFLSISTNFLHLSFQKNGGMKRFFILLIIWNLSVLSVFSQKKGNQIPKLVVEINVENMRADYIDRFWNLYQNGGFKRLVDNGAVFTNSRIDIHNLKPSTVIASLSTGTYPAEHGIVGDKWFKQLTEETIYSVRDNYYLTLGSDSEEGNVSAKQLKVFTLGDVLKQQTNGRSKVFSLSLNANAAVLSAGHSANGAFWYDKTNGNFISSSYYMEQFPEWIIAFNNKKFAQQYMSRDWDLLLPASSYKYGFDDAYILEDGFWKRWNTFPYQLNKVSKDQEFPLEIIKATPFGNKLLRDFAVQLIDQESLGQDEYPDLLNITFSALDYAAKWYSPSSVEVQESFVRIDKEIASILEYLDKIMGKDNYLVVLSSVSTSGYPVRILKDEFNFEAGEFSPQSAMALLRSYLNALYGVGEWIETYNEEQVYLNHNLISKKEKPLDEMRLVVASFLNQFTGVKAAVPANLIETANLNNPRFMALENSYCVQRSGDIVILLEEGWYPTYRYHQVDYSTENRVPVIFYGMYVKAGNFNQALEIIDVVPTISHLLNILPPDDAKGKIIDEIIRK